MMLGTKGSTRTMALSERDALRHTYAEYLTWPEGGRNELIGGTAYVREPPAPTRSHQELVGELYHQLRLALDGKSCRPYIGVNIDWDRLPATLP